MRELDVWFIPVSVSSDQILTPTFLLSPPVRTVGFCLQRRAYPSGGRPACDSDVCACSLGVGYSAWSSASRSPRRRRRIFTGFFPALFDLLLLSVQLILGPSSNEIRRFFGLIVFQLNPFYEA